MAVRSGAGTGVVVSLVVFVLTTVFLLVLTIVFYAGKTNEIEAKANAETTLARYVRNDQRNNDAFKAFESAAAAERQSVAGHLVRRGENVMQYVAGDPGMTLEALQAEMARYKIPANGTVREALRDLDTDLKAAQSEVESLTKAKADLDALLAQKDTEISQLRASSQEAAAQIDARMKSYEDSLTAHETQVAEAVNAFNQAKDTLEGQYAAEVRGLQDEVDRLNVERGTFIQRINEFEHMLAQNRERAKDPSLLVDGHIIDAGGANNQVFIDRGKKHRVVLGMTFEVYSDESVLGANTADAQLARGKASLQVIKVGDTTSTCKVTRSTPGQPIVRNDVIANVVYDPTYKFKFLVHGKFDVDLDGKPSEAEAEFLRSKVLEWGGTIVTGEELPGNLDFLVLGEKPPTPPPPPANAPEALINDYVRKKNAAELYERLFRQAREAQIPVLNSNRFFVLIGYTDR